MRIGNKIPDTPANILVVYYSSYGHIFTMAKAVVEGRRERGRNPHILVTDGIGGSPYGPSTLAGPDGSRQPIESELLTARNPGSRVAKVAARVRDMPA